MSRPVQRLHPEVRMSRPVQRLHPADREFPPDQPLLREDPEFPDQLLHPVGRESRPVQQLHPVGREFLRDQPLLREALEFPPDQPSHPDPVPVWLYRHLIWNFLPMNFVQMKNRYFLHMLPIPTETMFGPVITAILMKLSMNTAVLQMPQARKVFGILRRMY